MFPAFQGCDILPIRAWARLSKDPGIMGTAEWRWWLQRDSNPCFSLERGKHGLELAFHPAARVGPHRASTGAPG